VLRWRITPPERAAPPAAPALARRRPV